MEKTSRNVQNTIPATENIAVKRHIARLAWLIGTGQEVSATVPASEIKKAETYLREIGIARPFTARTPNVSVISADDQRWKSVDSPPRRADKIRRRSSSLHDNSV